MPRKHHKRKKSYKDDTGDFVSRIFLILLIGAIGWVYINWEKIASYGLWVLFAIVVIAIPALFVLKRFKNTKTTWTLDDDKTLAMLKGLTPSGFEEEISLMFSRMGFETKVQGGANDGGVDVVAIKEGKKYYIQCKKFLTSEVTPHDIRDFLGAITNSNNPADKGYFVTTGNFTLMAEKAAEGNPRIELIDGIKLIEYYKLSHNGMPPETSANKV